ncbi:hypothetical protein [Rubricoccus marinus]|uniref:Uncharacterized protein n=1 Tax=Rubricoccus marinus TaxID=716817 RepID=A0A259TYE8_9BACT|nr:hypothetical protein [Rubricoccus marinus]OZC02731.1 hypothetical protein BSZ36_06940 [Rubricoccus marinus]
MLRLAALAVLIVSGGLAAQHAQAGERPAVADGAEPTVADTLRYTVTAGSPLIVALPVLHEGRSATYRLLDAPALSWLVDRSFLWRTTPSERGTLPVQIERTVEGAGVDRLVLMVEIRPS